MVWPLGTLIGAAAGALALTLAAIVLVASRTRSNRWLAALLVAEGGLQSMAVLNEQYSGSLVLDIAFIVSFALAPPLALAVLASLDTPLVAWMRGRPARVGIVTVTAAFLAMGVFVVLQTHYGDASMSDSVVGVVGFVGLLLFLVLVYVFSLVASISAFRRAEPGTLARARAKAFAIAFGTRDALVGGFLGGVVLLGVAGEDEGRLNYIPGLATVAYVLLLAYGILRTQLFDIDLKIKVGIRRSTVITIMLVVALAAAKTGEFYLNKTYGWIAGGVAAGMMLFVAPRLNKMGEKVAATAMPKVNASAEYLTARKLEVYRAAVETAWEDGSLTPQERAILDRLREKLEISGAEAYEVEADVTRALRSPPGGATPATAQG